MRYLALTTALAVALSGLGGAQAADLFRHHYKRHYGHGPRAYPDDVACQTFEPTEYEPRTLNFHQPLCYAARPYGISEHLYDYSTLLRGSRDDEY